MTNITGKIYQMKNADGTENRFPRTVIEAVLGLSSYLQDQFSSLADIYMPIEGIYEALAGQEFVFRKSPNTIKAKSLTIDRIKGKTLAWNSRIVNGNFSDGLTGWGAYQATASVSNNECTVTVGEQTTNAQLYQSASGIKGHIYYQAFSAKASQSGQIYNRMGGNKLEINVNTSFVRTSRVYTCPSTGDSTLEANAQNSTLPQDATYTVKDVISVDLTLLYGSEIDGMTDAEILAKFESEFPGYHDYTPGTLISNDAEAVETIGVNQWDEEWENGIYSSATGGKSSQSGFYRSANYVPVFPSTEYYYKAAIANTRILFYGDNYEYLGSDNTIANREFTTPANCRYITFYWQIASSNDVCINLSNPAINGQYFPYWKRGLQLGLNSFKVKDGNGNIITITGGLKSAGSVRDEIVGNKYIRYVATRAYQSGDENNSTVTTDGHEYTNYALATPIEYDLVEPLIYTMKAGTTEERISPNSDGLSAPFCCDITYSASENNDSESAQYAATAGRLLNSHKIWGQDFNGTEDITGELTGVTNLIASGIITGSRLVSTVATGTAPLAVSSTTMVQNLVAEKASKLLTSRTIWGQNFDGSGNISGAISNITTISASGLATISGGVALGTSTKAQAAKMVWEEADNAWHLKGNLYADGFLTAGGINSGNDAATLIFGKELSSSGEIFSISAGLYDAPNDEYFTVPSSDSAQELDTGHILATKADIDTINARIQAIVDNNALFEPTE